jgi:hypothetical protein
MKNQHSTGKFCKRLAAPVFLAGSMLFSAPAHSETPNCTALYNKVGEQLQLYNMIVNICMQSMIPEAGCPELAEIRYQYYKDALAAYSAACEG